MMVVTQGRTIYRRIQAWVGRCQNRDIQGGGLLVLLGSTLLIHGIVVSVLVVATGIAFITMLAGGYGANDDS
jgi:hypothetical protein